LDCVIAIALKTKHYLGATGLKKLLIKIQLRLDLL